MPRKDDTCREWGKKYLGVIFGIFQILSITAHKLRSLLLGKKAEGDIEEVPEPVCECQSQAGKRCWSGIPTKVHRYKSRWSESETKNGLYRETMIGSTFKCRMG